MRSLDTSACTATIGFPPKQGTWDFLQLAYTEGINAAIISLIGPSYSTSTVYILSGCNSSVVADSGDLHHIYTVTAGAVFYNGEFFVSDYVQYTVSSVFVGFPPVIIASLAATNFVSGAADPLAASSVVALGAADPVVFTDGISRSVHNIRKVSWVLGLSGTGTLSGNSASDIGNAVYIYPSSQINLSGSWGTLPVSFNAGNTYVNVGVVSSSNTVSLNYTGASIGARIKIIGSVAATHTISIPVTSPDVNYVKASSLTAPAGSSYCFITITYLGYSGGHYTLTEVTYDV